MGSYVSLVEGKGEGVGGKGESRGRGEDGALFDLERPDVNIDVKSTLT